MEITEALAMRVERAAYSSSIIKYFKFFWN